MEPNTPNNSQNRNIPDTNSPRKTRQFGTIAERQSVNFLEKDKQQKNTRKKISRVVFIFALLFFVFVAFGQLKGAFGNQNVNDPNIYDPTTLETKKPEGFFQKITHIFKPEPKLDGQKDDRINILLLGMGGLGHDGPFLTDTMILASIKPSTSQVAMVSIPRDLGVKIPGHGWNKINHANAFGEADNPGDGAKLAVTVVEDTFDVEIPYYIRVDFKAFAEIVDVVGGVKIDVERSFTDIEYPDINDTYQTVRFQKGIETMDGDRALQYARSRHGNNHEGSDFARAKRQQKVILALKEKLTSFQTLANPIKLSGIIKSLGSHMQTNLSFSDIISFIRLAKDMEMIKLSSTVIDSSQDGFLNSGFTKEGAFILKPKTGNFDDINKMIDEVFVIVEETPDTTPNQDIPALTPAKVEVLNGTWQAGMAARIRQRLINKEVTVSNIGNTNERPISQSGIYVVSDISAPDVLEILKNSLGIPVKQTIPEGEAATSTTDILIILGENFEE